MKTKSINNTICGYLKLIYLPSGVVSVYEEAKKQCGDRVFIDDSIYTVQEFNPVTGIARDKTGIPFILQASHKVIAASPSMNLPVFQLPEKQDVEKAADAYLDGEITIGYMDEARSRKDFIAGYNARGGYTEEDMRNCFEESRKAHIFEKQMPPKYESFEQFLASLRPHGVWCEMVETDLPVKESAPGDLYAINGKLFMHYFKAVDNKLVVLEWENNNLSPQNQ